MSLRFFLLVNRNFLWHNWRSFPGPCSEIPTKRMSLPQTDPDHCLVERGPPMYSPKWPEIRSQLIISIQPSRGPNGNSSQCQIPPEKFPWAALLDPSGIGEKMFIIKHVCSSTMWHVAHLDTCTGGSKDSRCSRIGEMQRWNPVPAFFGLGIGASAEYSTYQKI